MSFSTIRDQEVAVRFLQSIVRQGRIPNGMLFWGPGGVGKSLTAFETAKAINCTAGGGDACDECLSCRKIAHGTHADVKAIIPAGKVRVITVKAIEAIIEMTSYRPYEGNWRVVLIQEADRLNSPAQNHFLKTLEEPPSNTAFILISEYPKQLLPTIRSRCQHVRFGALSPGTVADLLCKNRNLSPGIAEAIAAISQGQMSRALDLVDTEKREIVLDTVTALGAGGDPLSLSGEFTGHLKKIGELIRLKAKEEAEAEGMDPAEQSGEDRVESKDELEAYIERLIRINLIEYLYLFKTWYRDELVYSVTGDPNLVLNRDQIDRFKAASAAHAAKLDALEQAWTYIERNLPKDRVFRDLFFVLAS